MLIYYSGLFNIIGCLYFLVWPILEARAEIFQIISYDVFFGKFKTPQFPSEIIFDLLYVIADAETISSTISRVKLSKEIHLQSEKVCHF